MTPHIHAAHSLPILRNLEKDNFTTSQMTVDVWCAKGIVCMLIPSLVNTGISMDTFAKYPQRASSQKALDRNEMNLLPKLFLGEVQPKELNV
jgi:hypothetical protein